MATVYLARDVQHDREVALKVLHPGIAAALGAERFLREIRIVASLAHPHILTLHDSGQAAGTLYYVMPVVESGSLRDRIGAGPLSTTTALDVARQVASALSFAHERGVIHRDVKPENILLSGDHALLTDFGVARLAEGPGEQVLSDTGMPIGTALYMSPEQAAGRRDVDGRTDTYSLGCVLWEMLAGPCLPSGAPTREVLERRFTEPLPELRRVAGVPDWVDALIRRATAAHPAERFQSAHEMLEALASASVPRPPRVRARARRLRWAVAVTVLLAAAASTKALISRPTLPPDSRRVLVAGFVNRTADPALGAVGEMATDYVARGIAATGLVEVIDARTQGHAADSAGLDSRSGRALARRVGAGTMIWGSYYRRGDSLEFSAEVIDAASGRLLRASPPAIARLTSPTAVVELLRQRVMMSMATLFDPRFREWEAASQPPTFEAYQEFLAARDLFFEGCDGCEERAMEHARRAVALDSSYTLPRTTLASFHMLLGDCAHTDSIAASLMPVRDRLPPVERGDLDVAQAVCRNDWRGALDGALAAWRAAPRSPQFAVTLPLLAVLVNRPRLALDVLGQYDPEQGSLRREVDYWWCLTQADHRLGDHAAELSAARRARQLHPDGWRGARALQFEVGALAALGRVDDVNSDIGERLPQPATIFRGDSRGWLMVRAALELRAHGHADASRALIERAVRQLREDTRDSHDGAQHMELASALYYAGALDEAREIATRVERSGVHTYDATGHYSPQSLLGVLAAQRGDRATAMRYDRWLAERSEPWLVLSRARIAASLGERARAVQLVRQAFEQGLGVDEWLHLAIELEPLRADPTFRALVLPRG